MSEIEMTPDVWRVSAKRGREWDTKFSCMSLPFDVEDRPDVLDREFCLTHG